MPKAPRFAHFTHGELVILLKGLWRLEADGTADPEWVRRLLDEVIEELGHDRRRALQLPEPPDDDDDGDDDARR